MLQFDHVTVGGDFTLRELTIHQHFGPERRDPASRHRRAMIEKVWAIWITGVLQPSLPQDILLELGLTERPAMVTRALDLYAQRPDLADQVQAPGTRLVDVFDRLDRALLILGAPGAGKTTLLLTLARDLLIRAAQDPEQPIPVVFLLSSWAEQRRSLAEWLMDALNEQYDIPRKIAQAWVESDHVLPLLDGLDEVVPEHRAACVEAINAFRQYRGLLPIVVCSRVVDYEVIGTRLRLQGALVVQPLTHEQIDIYLAQIGQPLATVRQMLRDDPLLWELLDTPLMLTIMTLAYAGQSAEALCMRGTLVERRQSLFAAYVNRMFQRRSAVTRYTRPQTERWLAWLAWQMTQHSQTVFYLERMQQNWLPPGQRWLPIKGILWGVGLGGGLGAGTSYGLDIGLLAGLCTGASVGLGSHWSGYTRGIVNVETVHWSWSAVRSHRKLLFWLLVGCLGNALGFGARYGLGFGLSRGEIKTQTTPNEGIHRSARMALGVGLGGGLFARLGGLWVYGPVYGLVSGLLGGLEYGGMTCLQHLVIRLLLVRNGSTPWRYVDFLDYAAERLFLRKVGGGYIFIHRLLQEYFAARHVRPQDAVNQDSSG